MHVYTRLGEVINAWKIVRKKERVERRKCYAPISGILRQLEEVPDPVFAGKMVGEGIAIEPSEGLVVAPFDGEVVQLFPTLHAVGLRSKSGLEILIHIGLETVSLQGEGFEAFIKQGDSVKMGDKLIAFNMDIISDKASSMMTPIIMTNGDMIENFTLNTESTVIAGKSTLITAHLK